MKIEKDYIINSISYIADEGMYDEGDEGYKAYEKFKSVENYAKFLELNLQDEDYEEFRLQYKRILNKYNQTTLDLFDPDFEPDLQDEESDFCNEFALHILKKYVTNYKLIRDRKLEKILNA